MDPGRRIDYRGRRSARVCPVTTTAGVSPWWTSVGRPTPCSPPSSPRSSRASSWGRWPVSSCRASRTCPSR
ncbi:hypothetical protein [Ornithinimicrobium kibberense]|uniref:hypothetical protein n=1 Tax=Ornithinimicrobium kibberense TaxID=282060 RepID=UPI003612896A